MTLAFIPGSEGHPFRLLGRRAEFEIRSALGAGERPDRIPTSAPEFLENEQQIARNEEAIARNNLVAAAGTGAAAALAVAGAPAVAVAVPATVAGAFAIASVNNAIVNNQRNRAEEQGILENVVRTLLEEGRSVEAQQVAFRAGIDIPFETFPLDPGLISGSPEPTTT
ncbi:MAG: hypothetical protein F6K19_42615, partial [Cyanothece sp. SIO1E1]|nr:hypothetical protein [Cyanothece sp. SIO1E1]